MNIEVEKYGPSAFKCRVARIFPSPECENPSYRMKNFLTCIWKYFLRTVGYCSMFPKMFCKKLIMWFCRESNSEQLLILNFMLKIRSYSSGNRRNFGKMSGIFAPSCKEFLRFSKIWLYLTLKNAISCHLRQKIEKMER